MTDDIIFIDAMTPEQQEACEMTAAHISAYEREHDIRFNGADDQRRVALTLHSYMTFDGGYAEDWFTTPRGNLVIHISQSVLLDCPARDGLSRTMSVLTADGRRAGETFAHFHRQWAPDAPTARGSLLAGEHRTPLFVVLEDSLDHGQRVRLIVEDPADAARLTDEINANGQGETTAEGIELRPKPTDLASWRAAIDPGADVSDDTLWNWYGRLKDSSDDDPARNPHASTPAVTITDDDVPF